MKSRESNRIIFIVGGGSLKTIFRPKRVLLNSSGVKTSEDLLI